MYLKSVEILNYRLFYGNNYFDFSSYENKSINIIFGRNGSGKSSLIDAIYWCLYGIEMREIGSEPIYNDIIAEETPKGDKFNVKVSLSLMDNQNREILIMRSICFHKGNNILINSEDFDIYVDEMNVSFGVAFIKKMWSKELFDLMYINEINVLSDNNFYNEIKLILFSYFQLNIISNASIHLKKSYNKLLNEYKKFNPKLGTNRYDELVSSHEELCLEIEKVSQKIHEIEQLIKEYQSNSISKDLFLKKEYLLKESDKLINEIEKAKSNYSHLVLSSFPMAVLFKDLQSNFDGFKTFLKNYHEEDTLKTSFVEDISKLKHDLEVLNDDTNHIPKKIKQIMSLKEQIINIHDELNSINNSLSNVDELKIREINSLQKELDYLVFSREELKHNEKSLKKEISMLDKEINLAKSKSHEFKKKEEFYRSATSSIDKLYDNLFGSILTEISDSVNNIFIQNFAMSDKYSNILIDDNFEFEIVKNSGKLIKFFDLSLSEQYILYFSFALSIQDIINQDIFLIIDTQFLNFDKEHWLNFLSLLKNNYHQCLLLFNEVNYEEVKLNLISNIANEYELINFNDKIKVIKHEN